MTIRNPIGQCLLARRWAQQHNIPVLGTLGMLKLAGETGVVPSLQPLLENLPEAGFRMKHDLYIRIMRQVGESDTE
jgi:predicted nucleic acid-binding protein